MDALLNEAAALHRWLSAPEGVDSALGSALSSVRIIPGDKHLLAYLVIELAGGVDSGPRLLEAAGRLAGDSAVARDLLGRQHEAILDLARRAAQIVGVEGSSLSAAMRRSFYVARIEAHDAARPFARPMVSAAVAAAAPPVAREAVADAAVALTARDHISLTGFTRRHYAVLTMPWHSVVGKVHPGDKTLAKQRALLDRRG